METSEHHVVSVAKTLTSLLAVPSNRSCADCRSTLVDASQVYASFSPNLEIPRTRYNHFRLNHQSCAPPGYTSSKIDTQDPPIDPSLIAASQVGEHGVFVCALCAAAHHLLGSAIATVRAVQDPAGWTIADVERLCQAGGNQQALAVLEAYLPKSWERKRPTSDSSVADRLVFVRSKYEALTFVFPPSGPLGARAWRSIVNKHPEWDGLWGADLLALSDMELRSMSSLPSVVEPTRVELPNRLVDYFCVVTASDYLDPTMVAKDLSKLDSPEDFLLAPRLSDCFPEQDTHKDAEFPQHVAMLVFPEGCHPRTTAMPPTLFTFTLTTGSGDRLYGAVLRLYDDGKDTECLREILEKSGYAGRLPSWLEETSESVIFLPKCLVVLSHYAFFDLWSKFLMQIYRIALVEAPLAIERFIANFVCEIPLPPPGKIQVKFGFTVNDMWLIERPPENQLPLANFSYKPLFTCLSVSNIMVVVACLMQETRVALVSRHYALLCPVAEALISFLFPFHWQGMYLPVMPYSMLEMLEAPVPYLVGLHSRYLREMPRERWPQGVVFVDLDSDCVHLGFDDDSPTPRITPCLPERLAMKLKAKLLEFGAAVYLMPASKKAGAITTGHGEPILNGTRDGYANILQSSEIQQQSNTSTTRKHLFGTTDRAYRGNELQTPIRGFLSEHGHLSGRDPISPSGHSTKERSNSIFRFRKHGKVSFDDGRNVEPDDENLFDLRGVRRLCRMDNLFLWTQILPFTHTFSRTASWV
jgi:hypothetical protein